MDNRKFLQAVVNGKVDLSGIQSQKAAIYTLNEATGKYVSPDGKEHSYKAITDKIISADGLISVIEIYETHDKISRIELLKITPADIITAKFS